MISRGRESDGKESDRDKRRLLDYCNGDATLRYTFAHLDRSFPNWSLYQWDIERDRYTFRVRFKARCCLETYPPMQLTASPLPLDALSLEASAEQRVVFAEYFLEVPIRRPENLAELERIDRERLGAGYPSRTRIDGQVVVRRQDVRGEIPEGCIDEYETAYRERQEREENRHYQQQQVEREKSTLLNGACRGCKHFHGTIYNTPTGRTLLVCGTHPSGPSNQLCPDHESGKLPVLDT